jgi:hypothetical protein
MSALSIQPPYLIFTDIDGQPLEDGFIWIGVANLDPQVNPINVYWDAALTIPAGQPIRTLAGYPANIGTPARLYVNSDYSIRVMNKNGSTVYSAPEATERYNEAVISGLDASNVLTTIGYTGGVQRTQQQVNDDRVCVFDFMTPAQIDAVKAGTSVEDLSTAFEQAINTSKRVFIPKGKYRVNVQIDSKVILEGEGGQSTILYPYDESVAIMTYTFTAQQTPIYAFWDYHSEVHGVGFWGRTTQTGIGFTFGTTVPSNYTTNMESANNVKFFGCRFYNLNKGIQFPFGNIGTEFYSCGFSSNYYGAYLLDCKFPAGSPNTMHAGNKYWYAGEFSSNEVGLYVNDVTDGFGAVELRDTIMEYNRCAAYLYIGARTFVPVKFENVWFEGNGSASSGPATVTVDTWTGEVKGTTTLNKKTVFIAGQNANVIFESSGTTDVRVMGTGCSVYVNGGWVARLPGFMGGTFEVDNPGKSFIRVDSPNSQGGFPVGPSVYTVGAPMVEDLLIKAIPTSALLRHYFTTPRASKIKNYGPSIVNALTLTGDTQLNGTALVGSTLVADGRIFSVCCEFTRAAFLNNQYLEINSPTSNINIGTAGYYVVTIDVKRTQGDPRVYIWDRDTKQFVANAVIPSLNSWYTLAAIGYSDGTAGTIYVDFQGDGGTCTWRTSAFQALRFDTYAEANMYLESGAYAMKQTMLSVASAATITAPQDNDIILVTGTTNINTITATGQIGRTITLVFDNVLTVNDGTGNLALAGNFTTSADDTLMLTCNGTTWYEVSRSAN